MARTDLTDDRRLLFGLWGDYKYRCFISYSHRDAVWADKLEAKLRDFVLPRELENVWTPFGPPPKRLKPFFRDRGQMGAHHSLGSALQSALDESASLIVLCSPASAASEHVQNEIEHFIRSGKGDRIFALIVDGEPNDPDQECFPKPLRFAMAADGTYDEAERLAPVAADAREQGDGWPYAFYKLVGGMAGLDADVISRRDQQREAWERRRKLIIAGSAVSVLLAFGAAAFSVYGLHAANQRAQNTFLASYALDALASGEANKNDALLAALEGTNAGFGQFPKRPETPEISLALRESLRPNTIAPEVGRDYTAFAAGPVEAGLGPNWTLPLQKTQTDQTPISGAQFFVSSQFQRDPKQTSLDLSVIVKRGEGVTANGDVHLGLSSCALPARATAATILKTSPMVEAAVGLEDGSLVKCHFAATGDVDEPIFVDHDVAPKTFAKPVRAIGYAPKDDYLVVAEATNNLAMLARDGFAPLGTLTNIGEQRSRQPSREECAEATSDAEALCLPEIYGIAIAEDAGQIITHSREQSTSGISAADDVRDNFTVFDIPTGEAIYRVRGRVTSVLAVPANAPGAADEALIMRPDGESLRLALPVEKGFDRYGETPFANLMWEGTVRFVDTDSGTRVPAALATESYYTDPAGDPSLVKLRLGSAVDSEVAAEEGVDPIEGSSANVPWTRIFAPTVTSDRIDAQNAIYSGEGRDIIGIGAFSEVRYWRADGATPPDDRPFATDDWYLHNVIPNEGARVAAAFPTVIDDSVLLVTRAPVDATRTTGEGAVTPIERTTAVLLRPGPVQIIADNRFLQARYACTVLRTEFSKAAFDPVLRERVFGLGHDASGPCDRQGPLAPFVAKQRVIDRVRAAYESAQRTSDQLSALGFDDTFQIIAASGIRSVIDTSSDATPSLVIRPEVDAPTGPETSGRFRISEEGLDLIKRFEGLELEAYRDISGILTIGYGSFGPGIVDGMRITEAEAEELLRADLRRFGDALSEMVTVPVTQSQIDALISLSYNIGTKNVRVSSMMKRLNRRDYVGAAEALTWWTKANGKVIAGLQRRRAAESALFLRDLDQLGAAAPRDVFVQYKAESQRQNADALVRRLGRQPIADRVFTALGAEQVAAVPSKTEIRYFYSEDKQPAEELARFLGQVAGCPIEVRSLVGQYANARANTVELWISDNSVCDFSRLTTITSRTVSGATAAGAAGAAGAVSDDGVED